MLFRSIKHKEPWAVKLCMEYFYPKGGVNAPTHEQGNNVNLNIIQTLNDEDQRTFLQLWMKSKRGMVKPKDEIIEGEIEGDESVK